MNLPPSVRRRVRTGMKPQGGPRYRTLAGPYTISLPVAVVSEANRRDHWAVRHRRFKAQAEAVNIEFLLKGVPRNLAGPIVVTLTRIGTRTLDGHDNLRGGFKAIVDAIAKWFNVDDGGAMIEWRYEQRKGKYGVEIGIQPKEASNVASS